jgi:nitric oxide reductase activation protein
MIDKYTSKLFDSDTASEIALGGAEYGEHPSVYFKKEKGDAEVYNELAKMVSKYVPSIKKVLKGHDKNYDFTIHGCRHGLLDTTKLAEAYQGVQQVYLRQGHVRTNKTTLCVLIDESGSMGSNSYPCDCAFVARLAAVLINESLKNLPGVDLYVYGHTADIREIGETQMLVYREGNKYKDDSSFVNIHGRFQNRDGTAIYEAAKRVRKQTDSHAIMLILSDGEPYALNGYYGDTAISDVKKNVELVEKMDFEVIQVSIQQIDSAKEMFKNVVCLYNDLANLPKELSLLVRKLIVADKKTVIT